METVINAVISALVENKVWAFLILFIAVTLAAALRKIGSEVVADHFKKHPAGSVLTVVVPVLIAVVVFGWLHISNPQHPAIGIDDLTNRVNELEKRNFSTKENPSTLTDIGIQLKLQLGEDSKGFIGTQVSEIAEAIRCRDAGSCEATK